MSTSHDTQDTRRVRLEQARFLLEAGRANDAVQLLAEFLAESPDDAQAMSLMARAAIVDDRSDDALGWSEAALRAAPNDVTALVLRAAVLLDLGTDSAGALADAVRAAELLPHRPEILLVVVRAQIACHDLQAAAITAASIRSAAPNAPQGPLAQAFVELALVARIDARRMGAGPVVWLTLWSGGFFLVGYGLWWLAQMVRRTPHLRRADDLVQQALGLDPDDALLHLEASDLLARRYHYGRAVGSVVDAAGLDGDLVDSERLASTIATRLAGAAAVAFPLWIVIGAIVAGLAGTPAGRVAASGIVALAAVTGVVVFERRQLRLAPRRLRAEAHRRLAPLLVALGTTCLLVVQALLNSSPPTDGGPGTAGFYWAGAAVWATATVLLGLRTAIARRFRG